MGLLKDDDTATELALDLVEPEAHTDENIRALRSNLIGIEFNGKTKENYLEVAGQCRLKDKRKANETSILSKIGNFFDPTESLMKEKEKEADNPNNYLNSVIKIPGNITVKQLREIRAYLASLGIELESVA